MFNSIWQILFVQLNFYNFIKNSNLIYRNIDRKHMRYLVWVKILSEFSWNYSSSPSIIVLNISLISPIFEHQRQCMCWAFFEFRDIVNSPLNALRSFISWLQEWAHRSLLLSKRKPYVMQKPKHEPCFSFSPHNSSTSASRTVNKKPLINLLTREKKTTQNWCCTCFHFSKHAQTFQEHQFNNNLLKIRCM